MGIGMVALAFTAVYRGASSGSRQDQVPPPASTGLEQGGRHRRPSRLGRLLPASRLGGPAHALTRTGASREPGENLSELVVYQGVYLSSRRPTLKVWAGLETHLRGPPRVLPRGGEDEYRSVVFDESFVRAARLQEFSAQERIADHAPAVRRRPPTAPRPRPGRR